MNELYLRGLTEKNIVFWSEGNRPTQLLMGLSKAEVLFHLKILYLLADRILGSASYFYESPITREITDELCELFSSGDILYFIDENVEHFKEHGLRKIEKSPKSFQSYHDRETVISRAKKLDTLGNILRRPSVSISDQIVDLWVNELMSDVPNALGKLLSIYYPNPQEFTKVRDLLIGFAKFRNKDFVWEYLAPKLRAACLPHQFLRAVRVKLSGLYFLVTCKMLGTYLDRPNNGLGVPLMDHSHRFDISLFLECMRILCVDAHLRRLITRDLISLKYSIEFTLFKEFYFRLIETIDYDTAELKIVLPIYKHAATKFPTAGYSVSDFLDKFSKFCKAIKRPEEYKQPLDVLLRTYDTFNSHSTIDNFIERIVNIPLSNPIIVIDNSKEVKDRKPLMNKKNGVNIFISYAHEDEGFKKNLENHLCGLNRKGIVNTWSDRQILPGEEWENEIRKKMDACDMVLFLVSSDFMASDYINDVEIARAIDRHKNSDIIIVPIVVRPCDLKSLQIGKYQALPTDAKPISSWNNQDEAYLDIIEGLKKIIEK